MDNEDLAQRMYPGRYGPRGKDYGFGTRHDGTFKGPGFLGPLKRADGGVSTELSIGVEIDGKQIEIPLLVPTLSKGQINHLLNDGEPTDDIVDAAVQFARQRMKEGKRPFFGADDEGK